MLLFHSDRFKLNCWCRLHVQEEVCRFTRNGQAARWALGAFGLHQPLGEKLTWAEKESRVALGWVPPSWH